MCVHGDATKTPSTSLHFVSFPSSQPERKITQMNPLLFPLAAVSPDAAALPLPSFLQKGRDLSSITVVVDLI